MKPARASGRYVRLPMRTSVLKWLFAMFLLVGPVALSHACTLAFPPKNPPPEFLFEDARFNAVFVGKVTERLPGSWTVDVSEALVGEVAGFVHVIDVISAMCGIHFDVGDAVVVAMYSANSGRLWHLDAEETYMTRLRAARVKGQSNNRMERDTYSASLRAPSSAPHSER